MLDRKAELDLKYTEIKGDSPEERKEAYKKAYRAAQLESDHRLLLAFEEERRALGYRR